MANKYAGTQTEKNLEIAFAGESQARNKYTYFASKAKKEGFEQIAALFLKSRLTVLQDMLHARILLSFYYIFHNSTLSFSLHYCVLLCDMSML